MGRTGRHAVIAAAIAAVCVVLAVCVQSSAHDGRGKQQAASQSIVGVAGTQGHPVAVKPGHRSNDARADAKDQADTADIRENQADTQQKPGASSGAPPMTAEVKAANAHHPLGSHIIAYDDGEPVALDSIDEGAYGGFIFTLQETSAQTGLAARIAAAEEAGVVQHIAGDMYRATALDDLDSFVDEQDVADIEPDYLLTLSDDMQAGAGAEGSAAGGQVQDQPSADEQGDGNERAVSAQQGEADTLGSAEDAQLADGTSDSEEETQPDESAAHPDDPVSGEDAQGSAGAASGEADATASGGAADDGGSLQPQSSELSAQGEYSGSSAAEKSVADVSDMGDIGSVSNPNDRYFQGAANSSGSYLKQTELRTICAQQAWQQVRWGKATTLVACIDSGIVGTGSSSVRHEDIDYSHVLRGKHYAVGSRGVQSDSDTADRLGHGTAIAGQMLATANNAIGIAGLCCGVYLKPYNVMQVKSDGEGTTSVACVILALNDAVSSGADVVNLSVGSPQADDYYFEQACKDAVDQGVILVASAGNAATSSNYYPAAFSTVIGVSATKPNGVFDSSYSNRAESTDAASRKGAGNVYVAAPGTNLVLLSNQGPREYTIDSGTSFSAPYVSALAALAHSANPALDQDSFKELLKSTSRDKGASGFDVRYGWGVIDCGALIGEIRGVPKKGKTYPRGKLKYKVIRAATEKKTGTVSVTGVSPIGIRSKSISVPDTAKINGFAFKVVSVAKKALTKADKATKLTIACGSLKSIGYRACYKMDKLKTVTIKARALTQIGKQAFAKDTRLKTLKVSSAKLATIDEQAFSGDKALKSVTLTTRKLAAVGSRAFRGVRGVCRVNVPNSKAERYRRLLRSAGLPSAAHVR